jgi:RNase adaptor protein for sRNA GlmZ degradation
MTTQTPSILTVELFSFSYKRPVPEGLFSSEGGRHGGGFVFDCRCPPNPGREERYKTRTGLDQDVVEYLTQSPEVQVFRQHTFGLITNAVENYLTRDFEFLAVAFGCTGGQHRSVFFADQLSKHLAERFAPRVTTRVTHTNLGAL